MKKSEPLTEFYAGDGWLRAPRSRERLSEAARQAVYETQNQPLLKDLIALKNPIVITGQGGSGTRLIAELLAATEQFGLLYSSSRTKDCFSWRFCGLNEPELIFDLIEETGSVNYKIEDLSYDLRARVDACLEKFLLQVVCEGRSKPIWGFKEPLLLYWLPFLYARFPAMKVIHVVRDIRGYSMSRHIQAFPDFASVYLDERSLSLGLQGQFETIWARQTSELEAWFQEYLAENSLTVLMEDLTGPEKETAIAEMLHFCGIEYADIDALAELARPLRQFEPESRSGLVGEVLRKYYPEYEKL